MKRFLLRPSTHDYQRLLDSLSRSPDYYAVGMLAIIVIVRTVLSFSINRELMSISKEE
jgi:uncharacterized membrane protein